MIPEIGLKWNRLIAPSHLLYGQGPDSSASFAPCTLGVVREERISISRSSRACGKVGNTTVGCAAFWYGAVFSTFPQAFFLFGSFSFVDSG